MNDNKILEDLSQKLHEIAIESVKLTYASTIEDDPEEYFMDRIARVIAKTSKEEIEDEYSKYVKSYKCMPEDLYNKMKKEKGVLHPDCQIELRKIYRDSMMEIMMKEFGDYDH